MIAADLYCGAGGASRGLHMAGFDVPHGVDHNRAALRSYNESLPGDPIEHDLRITRPSILPPLGYDLVHGSPPCQGFSQAKGVRDPDDDRNQHVWRYIEWVRELQPKVATMENVTGMASITNTFMDRLTGAFRDIGYAARWRTLNAADYGVPQTRKRVFVVAVRDDLPTPSRWFPKPTHAKGGTSTLGGERLKPWRTVRDAIGDLFLLADGGVITSQQNEGHQAAGGTPPMVVPNHTPEELSDKGRDYLERDPRHLAKHPPNEFDAPSRTVPANIHKGVPYGLLRLPNHEPVEPSEEAREKMAAYAPGSSHNSVTERRLAGDEPAFTVAASRTQMIAGPDVAEQPSATIDTNGYLYERGHHYNQTEARVRRLTVREAARLQSFPDSHLFVGNKTDQYRQVGNAVPPLLMYAVARHIWSIIEDAEARNAGGRD